MTLLRRLTTLTAIATGTAALTLAAPGIAAAGPAPMPAPAVPAVTAPSAQVAPGDLFAGYRAVVEALRTFGIEPFLYPAVAPFCSDTGSLGLVPAVAGAVPGPWPKTTVAIPGLDPTAVKAGQVMFTFVPYGLGPDSANASGMNVAWVNLANGRSGITPMGSISDVVRTMVPAETPTEIRPLAERAIQDFFAAFPVGGVRAVPIETGSGPVLAAIFGTIANGPHSCLFLPTINLTPVR
ncbi:hypothetical protein [Nocardia vinacea]|uniref:hypothetical protein n=1 Tax=Nocardia vinacea TaxID=96468 RepID=UPI0003174688|nr:hypothetical protein [Nocardia vinacea]